MDIQNRIDSGVTALDVHAREISSLKGLEYFEGIIYLICTNNKLTSLPSLPSTLTELHCGTNQLTALPDLPNTLKYLDCSNNNITVLPAIPSNVKSLICDNNKLNEIPTLPAGMQEVHCMGNKLRTINIPSTLIVLRCNDNMLTSLPTLPGTLIVLSCESNQLTRFPAIPSSLRDINVRENNLTELPTLPATVSRFRSEYNYLDVFGTSLGNALNKPNYSYKPQYRIQYAGPETLEVEMGKTVTIDNIKKQMSSDGNVWGDVEAVSLNDLTFTSSNNSVAKVDSAGGITGVSIGTTHINVFYKGIDSKLTKAVIFVKVIATTAVPEPTTEPPQESQPPQYGDTSAYAVPFMDQAAELGIITDRLKGQSMIVATTRQEFAEMAVKFYEKVTGKTAPIPSGKTFTDCNNPEVLKAFDLKITYGTGDGTQFEPDAKLSRQQMAAMIERTLKACYPNIVIDTLGQPDFKDQKDFASYAITPAKFMAKYEITVGDGQGNFNPNDDCLRQQTFIFLVKAYNFRDKYIFE